MTRLSALVCCLLLAAPVWADPPEVPKEPLKLKVGEDSVVVVKVPAGKKGAFGEGFRPADCLFFRGYSASEAEMTFLVRPKRPGYYRVVFWTVGEADRAFLDIDAGGEPPVPPPPGPSLVIVPSVVGKSVQAATEALNAVVLRAEVVGGQGLVVSQAPAAGVSVEIGTKVTITTAGFPPPPPPVPPAPIPVAGFRVVIVEESADRNKLPKGQQNIIFSATVRDYLRSHCVSKTAWGIFDKDDDVSAYGPELVTAMKRPRTSLPWIVISNHPAGGYEGPLPSSVDETMTLLKKYGGN